MSIIYASSWRLDTLCYYTHNSLPQIHMDGRFLVSLALGHLPLLSVTSTAVLILLSHSLEGSPDWFESGETNQVPLCFQGGARSWTASISPPVDVGRTRQTCQAASCPADCGVFLEAALGWILGFSQSFLSFLRFPFSYLCVCVNLCGYVSPAVWGGQERAPDLQNQSYEPQCRCWEPNLNPLQEL